MKTSAKLPLLFSILLFLQCQSSYKILKPEQEKGFQLSNYSTFGFYESEVSDEMTSPLFNSNIKLIKEAISGRLKERGLNEAQDPELKINIALSVKEEIQTRQTDFQRDGLPRYMGQRRYSWKSEEVPVGKYKEGTMLLEFVEAANNKMVWKSGAKGVLPKKDEKVTKNAVDAVQAIFSKIP